MRQVTIAYAALVVGLSCSSLPAAAQTSGTRASGTANAQELYEVHFVKAAPGKARELIDGYLTAPTDPNAAAPPLMLRHAEGDDWDLMVLTPLGKQDRLTSATPSASEMQFIERMRPLRAMHSDTIAIGSPWSEMRAALGGPRSDVALAGTSGSSGDPSVYIVTTYRAIPGHRDQLQQVLKRLAALDPARTVTMQHMEGAAWDFVLVQRYDSWAAFAQNETTPNVERLRAQGFSSPEGPWLELREHMAEHHDTIATRVESAPK